MFKFAKYLLLFIAFSLCCSCAAKRKPATYYPNQRKAPSGVTDNCDCAREGRNRTNAKSIKRPLNGVR